MRIDTDGAGQKVVRFATQHGTEGSVDLGVSDDAQAQQLVKDMKVSELETVSSIVNLTHQVVTQIVAGKKVSIADAVNIWEKNSRELNVLSCTTIRNNRVLVDAWARDSGVQGLPVTAVEPAHVSRYVNQGNERRSTAVRKLSAIRQFFNFCHQMGYVTRNPAGNTLCRVNYDSFKHVEKEKTERETFTPEEISRLLEVATPFWRAAVVIARDSGLRLGDICKLEWACFQNGRLIVWTEKSDKRVDIPLTEDINSVMGQLPETGVQYCFPEQRELLLNEDKRSFLSMQFNRLCKRAGLTGKVFHGLRHTNATNLIESGNAIERVAERLGHGSTDVTRGYIHGRSEVGS